MPRGQQGGGRSRPGQRQQLRQRRWQESLQAIMDPTVDDPAVAEINVGRRLRELRNLAGLSVRSLAEMSGLNFNTLSLIENEKTSPSVGTLQHLAHALRVPITVFFETSRLPKEAVFQKAGKRPRAAFAFGLLEDLGSGLTLGEGLPLLVTLEPGADSGAEAIVHTGQEFVYCLEGCLVYTVGNQEYVLEVGDSLIFQAHLPHRWINKGGGAAKSLLILCPSDENDRSAEQHFVQEQGNTQ
ncbi:MAG: cupin domain-containing protein [Anaerolineales bacterium]|nr:cupin domain-containing protein [Anaerolineales bacterium]